MRIPGNKTILLALGALVALAIAGCGGGGGGETETSTPTVEEPVALTKDELIEQGDGVCAEVNAAVGALSGSETSESTPGESTEKIANLYVGMVERLQGLGAPEGEEADYAKFMEAGEELAKVEGEAKLAAEREDVAALEEKGQEAKNPACRLPRLAAAKRTRAAKNSKAKPKKVASNPNTSNPNTKNPLPKKKSPPKRVAPAAAPKHPPLPLNPAANPAASAPAELGRGGRGGQVPPLPEPVAQLDVLMGAIGAP
jgi:hypothetical protein